MIQHCTIDCVCAGGSKVPQRRLWSVVLVSCEDVLYLSHAAFITHGVGVHCCATKSSNCALTH